MRKIIPGLLVTIIITIGSYKLGYFNGEYADSVSTDKYLQDFRRMEESLISNNADKKVTAILQAGDYVLEIHSPKRVTDIKLKVSLNNNAYVFTTTDGLSSGTSAKIDGNTIKWSWDIGYRGTEYYIGHIHSDCLIGDVFVDNASGKGICKWLIKLK